MEKSNISFTIVRMDKYRVAHVSTKPADSFFERIKKDTKKGEVYRLRQYVALRGSDNGYKRKGLLPRVYLQAEMENGNDGSLKVKGCLGLTWLHIGGVKGYADGMAVKKAAMALPMTYAAFTGADGKSVEVLVRATTNSGVMPTEEEGIDKFCTAAYRIALNTYANVLPLLAEATAINARCCIAMPLDPEPYYNAQAVPLRVDDGYKNADAQVAYSPLEEKKIREEAASSNKRAAMTKKLIEYLEEYEFRYNVLLGRTEFIDVRDIGRKWIMLSERTIDRLTVEATMKGIEVRDKDVRRIVTSDLVAEYHAAKEYLRSEDLYWDGKTDYIGMMARRVKNNLPQWEGWFKKWFLYMVAQWAGMPKGHGNSTVPLLIAGQGYNKSTFCRMLLPPELQDYYNDNLQANNKTQMLRAMHQYLLINLDEFNQISAKLQAGFLKNLLQLANIKGRRSYGKSEEEFDRTASFIATTNEPSVLADPTGSRRFIGVELTAPIDVSGGVNYRQMYGQAMRMLDSGEQYWFSKEEEKEIMTHNRKYVIVPPVVELFHEYFEVAQNAEDGKWMTITALYNFLRKKGGAGLDVDCVSQLGRYLSPLFNDRNKKRLRDQTWYLVKMKEG